MFVTTCCDIVSLRLTAMCQAPTYLICTTTPEAGLTSTPQARPREHKAVAQSYPARKGQGLDWNPPPSTWRRKQTSTHTAEDGRYPTPHTAVSGIAHQYIFILLCWHHLAKMCTASMPSANLQLRTQPSDLTVVWLFPPPSTPFLGWFLLTAL